MLINSSPFYSSKYIFLRSTSFLAFHCSFWKTWGKATIALILGLYLVGCSGLAKTQTTLDGSLKSLEEARKLGCTHESLDLAEKVYAKAQKLMEEKKYDEAQKQALSAKQLAEEVRTHFNNQPCPVDPPPEETTEQPLPNTDTDTDSISANQGNVDDLKIIYFPYDSFKLTPQAKQDLEENLTWLQNNPNGRFILGGHCDPRGTVEYNMALSEKRAYVVAQYLEKQGITLSRFQIVPYGSEELATQRTDPEGYQKNRRVEFTPLP